MTANVLMMRGQNPNQRAIVRRLEQYRLDDRFGPALYTKSPRPNATPKVSFVGRLTAAMTRRAIMTVRAAERLLARYIVHLLNLWLDDEAKAK